MTSEEIRQKFLKFFEERGHRIVPSSSLVPEGDSSVLFTTAGMQQFKPYYIGKKDPLNDFGSKNTVSIQKCIRTSDIEEVGDDTHLTFFEMLGNFSFGGYWKKEAIQYAHDFITKEMGLVIDYVSVFRDDESGIPADEESREIWQSIDPSLIIKDHKKEDNFWGPTGEEGPCGPTTEIYINGVEIWNIVFNEFYKDKEGNFKPLDQKGIDTGMGLERLTQTMQQTTSVFETDLFSGISNNKIIADHIRAAVFMIAEGIEPSNTERGYVLRRVLRRAILNETDITEVAERVIQRYKEIYDLLNKRENILNILKEEGGKFQEIMDKAVPELAKLGTKKISGKEMFRFSSVLGIPPELAESLGYEVDQEGFDQEMLQHKEISRAGSDQKFKGGLAGHSEMEVKYHTATHLLHQALREVLGNSVEQKGSNITPERLRFDFSHPQKMTEEEKKKVEDIVNEKIKQNLKVNKVVLHKEEAEKIGALHFFGDKYGDEVSVYYIGDSLDSAYSKEFCGGPHVSHTGELGVFKISKEEAVAQGIRRIKAILE